MARERQEAARGHGRAAQPQREYFRPRHARVQRFRKVYPARGDSLIETIRVCIARGPDSPGVQPP